MLPEVIDEHIDTDVAKSLEQLTGINFLHCVLRCSTQCLQCFDAVGWATGRASGL